MNAIRESLKKFIEAYRERPCLWDPSNPGYTYKPGRMEAMNDLLNVYKEVDTDADVSSVRRKLNTIRTVYNKEKRRMQRTGDDRTSLWYFDMLRFLDNIRRPSNRRYYDAEKCQSTSGQEVAFKRRKRSSSEDNIKFEIEKLDSDDSGDYLEDSNQYDDSQLQDPFQSQKSTEQLFFDEDGECSDAKQLVIKTKSSTTDEFDSFANVIAISLRSLKHPQQTIAQKLISDVIFYSKLGKLNPETTISIPN